MLRGASIRFVDSLPSEPNMDPALVAELITPRTRAIVAMHYAGVACDMDTLAEIADASDLLLIEDAAQAVNSYYKGRALGGIGQLGAFSFHETKKIISGEGGMLVINDERLTGRAEIIWEKGTNRSAFFRGEVDKYSWVDLGSSFLPSEIVASFLFAQVEEIDDIQRQRVALWERYYDAFVDLGTSGKVSLPFIPEWATNNGHLFYLVCRSGAERDHLIAYLKEKGIQAVFHYLPLHRSSYFQDRHDGRSLPLAEKYSDTLVRLPLYYDLQDVEQDQIIQSVTDFFS
jgi:dTDP-4-amino-4,6-dideoxygalactose transaminase